MWWLTTWRLGTRMFFAKAESDGGGPLTFTAGSPATFDFVHVGRDDSTPVLLDYQHGTPVTGRLDGDEIFITVPVGVVGRPKGGDTFGSVASWTALDNGLPPFIVDGTANAPEVIDATPAYNMTLN